MARQPDHAHVVAEIFAAELRADAGRLRHLQHFLLHRQIAKRVPRLRALGRQRVVIMRGGELDRLHGQFGRGAADDDRQMIGRARRGAERQHLLLEEGEHAVVRQDRRRRLEQKRLVGRAAAFGDEQELVGVLALGVDLDLRRHVRLGVLLLEHGERRELRIAQIALEVGCRARPRRAPPRRTPSVKTSRPFLPMMMAVPVSWHIGSTPPAAMLAFLRKS